MGPMMPAECLTCGKPTPRISSPSPKAPCAICSDAVMYHDTQCSAMHGAAQSYEISNFHVEGASSWSTGANFGHGSCDGHTSCTPLTTQALDEHNLQHAHVDQPVAHQVTNKLYHKPSLEVRKCSPGVVPAPGMQTQIMSTLEDITHDTHNASANEHNPHKHRRKMYTHERLHNVDTQDMTGYNIPYKSNLAVANTEYKLSTTSNHELTTWGNDLAGVGYHLEDFDSGKYASADDFVVE